MSFVETLSVVFIFLGLIFFAAGTVGLLRFPDVYARLHALTKADNLGLGLVTTGVALQASSGVEILKLVLIWVVTLISSATACYLVAHSALRTGIRVREET